MDIHERSVGRLESLIGSRVLLAAGLISLMLGTAFFVKVGSDHNWIPAWLRVFGGMAAGTALLAGGAALLGRCRMLIAEGLTALGGSVLLLAIWAGYGPLHVFSGQFAFACSAMIAVSVALAAIAWIRGSQNVALFGLAGSLATPMLLGTAVLSHGALATYLAAVFGAMLVLAPRCRYRFVELMAFAGALLYAPEFMPSDAWTRSESIITATVFFAEFALAMLIATRRRGMFDRRALALMTLQIVAYAAVLESEFGWQPHVLALYDAVFGGLLFAAVAAKVPPQMRDAYVWLGLGLLTCAVAAWSGTHALNAVLAVEAAGLVFRGSRGGIVRQRAFGYVLASIAVCMAAFDLLSAPQMVVAVFNSRTFTIGCVSLCLLISMREVRDAGPIATFSERRIIVPLALLLGSFGILAALSRDIVDLTGVAGTWLPQTQTWISILWSMYAAVLVAIGFRSRSMMTRAAGIALFATVTVKVFAIDLGGLDMMGRIISFFVLGSVLVAVAGGSQLATMRRAISR